MILYEFLFESGERYTLIETDETEAELQAIRQFNTAVTHFRPYEPEPLTFEQLKFLKPKEIVAARTEAERQPISYLGKSFATDLESLMRINIAAQSARNAITSGEEWSIDWVEGSSSTTLSAQEFLGLLDAITKRNNKIFELSQVLKEQIEQANTIEALQNIKWPENMDFGEEGV